MYLPISKNIETNYREGNVVLQLDYACGKMKLIKKRRLLDETRAREMKRFLLRGGYLGGKSLGDEGQAYKENTAFFELHLRTPLKGRVLLSHRLRTDLRWLGDSPGILDPAALPPDGGEGVRIRTRFDRPLCERRTLL